MHVSCQVWMGEIQGPEHYRQRYSVDAVCTMQTRLPRRCGSSNPPALHLLSGINSDRCSEISSTPSLQQGVLR